MLCANCLMKCLNEMWFLAIEFVVCLVAKLGFWSVLEFGVWSLDFLECFL